VDSLRSPLTPDVSCATVEMAVTHPAPSPAGRVPGASTRGPEPTSHPSAQSLSAKAVAARDIVRTAPHQFVPGHLVLAHMARTRPCVFGSHGGAPVPVVTTHIRAAVLQPCQSTGVLEMPSFSVHRHLGTPPSSPFPAKSIGAHVACPRFRPHAGALAASARTANPACSGLAQLRCARH
jgi:hypothetical protein